MFSLIITIISIALVTLLAVAALYFGGDLFGDGNSSASATKLRNEGSQILTAANVFKSRGGGEITNLETDLVGEGYLRELPSENWLFQDESDIFVTYQAITEDNEASCERFNEEEGVTGIPQCTDLSTVNARAVCCEN